MGWFGRDRRGNNDDELPDERAASEYYEDTHNDRGEYTGMLHSFNNQYQQRRDRRESDKQGAEHAAAQSVSVNCAMSGEPRRNYKFMVYEPKTLDDVQPLIDFLKRKEPAVINLKSSDPQKAQRILDFVSGAIYALNGTVHRIEDNIFILSPEDVEITIPYSTNDD